MTEVFLHVYDVANSESVKTSNAIVQLNKIFKDGIGLGGIFHSAIEVYGKQEWSFGFCEVGSGVFSCRRKENPMYVYRESLSLGQTQLSPAKVRESLIKLSLEWQGNKYDLLSRNCNHFCNDFCARLEVQKIPGWVNRFANAGETAVDVAETTMKRLRQAKTEVVSVSKTAYRAIFGGTFGSAVSPEPGLLESPSSSSNGGGNLLRLSFMKTPVSLFSKIGLGSASQPMDESVQEDELMMSNKNGSSGRSVNARVQGDELSTINKSDSVDHLANEFVQEDGSKSKRHGSVDVQRGGRNAVESPPRL